MKEQRAGEWSKGFWPEMGFRFHPEFLVGEEEEEGEEGEEEEEEGRWEP